MQPQKGSFQTKKGPYQHGYSAYPSFYNLWHSANLKVFLHSLSVLPELFTRNVKYTTNQTIQHDDTG